MKTTLKLTAMLLTIWFWTLQGLSGATISDNPATIEQYKDFYTIKGFVKDNSTDRILEYANISLKGTNIGTITNTDGYFSLKIKKGTNGAAIEVSHLGYGTKSIPVGQDTGNELQIALDPLPGLLDPVTIMAIDAKEIVLMAISRIESNYSNQPQLMTGFYRETIRKRRSYINVSEAVVDIYKRAYNESYHRDLLAVQKGRKLISIKPQDTLMVKFLGGPNLALYMDVVKNPDLMLSQENLTKYKFSITEIVMIEQKPHYVINFTPQVILPYALHYGKLFIDKETFALSRAQINVDMEDRNKVTHAILKKKPLSMRFKPESISFLVTYKQREGKTHLNYIRNEIQFKCDWKRRLFSTNYAIVAETVITGGTTVNAERIQNKLAFRDSQSLSDKVQDFYDNSFWENYNIIEPEESLENAVSRLMKQHR